MTNTFPTTTTYNLNTGEQITRAYRILGVLPSGGTPTADQFAQGIIALNGMLKGWQMDGINLYRQVERTVNVSSMGGSPDSPITLTDLVLGLEGARWVVNPGQSNQYERPLAIVSYDDYYNLPNKYSNTTSGPSQIMFNRQGNASIFQLWPIPTNGGILKLNVGRSVYNPTQASDVIDAPVEYQEAIQYNLADRLMDDEGVAAADPATAQRITEHAIALYQKLLNYDRPDTTTIRPWGKKGTGKFWR